jgi:hypothetical protein
MRQALDAGAPGRERGRDTPGREVSGTTLA